MVSAAVLRAIPLVLDTFTLSMFHVCFHHTLFRGSRPQAKMIQGYCSYYWLVPEKRSWNKIITVELIRTRITVVAMLNTVPKSYKFL